MYIETKKMNVSNLLLDDDNPRLPGYLDREQENMFEFLAKNSAIEELVSAIGANGFFESEPLIGVPHNKSIIIVEGNRRLTALKLLNDETFEGISKKLKDAISYAKHKPAEVSVAIYESRADVLNYLGNKHIAGVKPWGALAKARYAKQLLDLQSTDNSYQERIREVARSIGSRSDFLSRALKALDAYQIAQSNEFFGLIGVDEETVKFSLLGTALDYEGIQDFVYENTEIEFSDRKFITEHLKELFSWMFEKDETGKTRVGESRNLRELTKVVVSAEGLKKFRQGMSLSQAYKMTDGLAQEYDTLATKIQNSLREANSIVADVDVSEEREDTARSIFKQAQQLRNAFE
jgi:hypothetical protein